MAMLILLLALLIPLNQTHSDEPWSFPLLQNQHITTHQNIKLVDTLNNSTTSIPKGTYLKVVESDGKNFTFQVVDLNGSVIRDGRLLKGAFDVTPMLAKLTEKSLEKRAFDPFYEIQGSSKHCAECQFKHRTSQDKTTYERLAQLARSTYQKTWQETKSREKASDACNQALTQFYKSEESIWANLKLDQRATLTHQRILNMYKRLTSEPEAKTIKGMTNWEQVKNPHKWHILLKPEVATCTAFIELRGNNGLLPNTLNYTFCQKNNSSKAHGLGQMTEDFFKRLRGHPAVTKDSNNYLPITQSPKYEGIDDELLFYYLNDDVDLQIEVLLRSINYLVKMRKRTMPQNDQSVVRRAMADYDQDHESTYLKMFDRCVRCFESKNPHDPPSKCKVVE